MKLGYYIPQLKCKQIVKEKKVLGNILLLHYAYGYVVQLHYYGTPGYAVNKVFPTQEKAESFFDKTYEEATK